MFLDIILYKLACWFWPDKPKVIYQNESRSSAEEGMGWLILDELEQDGKLLDSTPVENDPYLNGDYEDGPDW